MEMVQPVPGRKFFTATDLTAVVAGPTVFAVPLPVSKCSFAIGFLVFLPLAFSGNLLYKRLCAECTKIKKS
jgi:hypothetical protein